MEYYKDLVVLITGASSGIGRGIAIEFAKHGSKLCISGRNQERLELTAEKCKEVGLSGDNILILTGDLTVQENVTKIVEGTVEKFGKLDVLVNNAGETRARNIDNCEVEDFDFVYATLVKSVFMMSKAALPHLEKTKGAIINMSSRSGLRPNPVALLYSTCKFAVDRFTQILSASESVAGKGIRVNSVNPGTIMTEFLTSPGFTQGDPTKTEKFLAWLRKAHPIGRVGEVEEVARLVVFMASKEANFMNGTLFPIDGALSNTSFIAQPKPGDAPFPTLALT